LGAGTSELRDQRNVDASNNSQLGGGLGPQPRDDLRRGLNAARRSVTMAAFGFPCLVNPHAVALSRVPAQFAASAGQLTEPRCQLPLPIVPPESDRGHRGSDRAADDRARKGNEESAEAALMLRAAPRGGVRDVVGRSL
jgi:hypothetical protein